MVKISKLEAVPRAWCQLTSNKLLSCDNRATPLRCRYIVGQIFRYMASWLPQELYHEIVNYASDDKEVLKACSLASRTLTEQSQKHLFSRVVLCTPTPPSQYASERLQNHRVYDLSGLPDKFSALLDTSPHIGDYINCLQIINLDDDLSDAQIGVYNDSLPRCLPRINNLKALVVFRLNLWTGFSQEVSSSFLHVLQLPSLIHLDLSPAPMYCLDTIIGRNVKHLCIRDDLFFQSSSLLAPSASMPIYLDSFLYRCPSYHLRLHNAFSQIKLSRLRKLVVVDDAYGPILITPLLLKLHHDTLEELTIIPNLEGVFPAQ